MIVGIESSTASVFFFERVKKKRVECLVHKIDIVQFIVKKSFKFKILF